MQSSSNNLVDYTQLFDENFVSIHIPNLDRIELNSNDHTWSTLITRKLL